MRKQSQTGLDSYQVAHALRSALRQHLTHATLSKLALSDDLTGLCNRRAFSILARERLNLARRLRKDLLLFFADLDSLKQINDRFGHQEGDRALRQAAEIFRATFRRGDITARFGGDEFAALVVEDARHSARSVSNRLRKNMNEFAAKERRYRLSLSVGMTRCAAEASTPFEELLARADQALYRHKRGARLPWQGRLVLVPAPEDKNAAASAGR